MEIWLIIALAGANLILVFALLMRKPPVNEAARAEFLAANERIASLAESSRRGAPERGAAPEWRAAPER